MSSCITEIVKVHFVWTKVFKIKQRIDSKAMLVLLDHESKILRYINEMPDIAWDLIALTEKPLTIIYSGAKNLAPNLIAADGSVGIRITKDTFSKKLCERLRRPIVSTSANISGEKSPSFYNEISADIKQAVDYIVDYRREDVTPSNPSSIIKLGVNGEIKIIRE